MNQWNLSRSSYERILQHLNAIEESRVQWLYDNFQHLSQDRDQMVALLDEYVEKLNLFIGNLDRSIPPGNHLPFAIMGSVVKVSKLDEQQQLIYRILPIYEERVGSGDISILSPLGNALLLQEPGSVVIFHAPRGDISYRIDSVSYYDG